jgi:capsular polysaccharide biosynthesis protein
MDQQNMVNVSIAREPRRPLTPAGFSKLGLLASALVLVSICSVALGFARDFFDHSFTTGEELERKLEIPHLASVPELREVRLASTDVALPVISYSSRRGVATLPILSAQ